MKEIRRRGRKRKSAKIEGQEEEEDGGAVERRVREATLTAAIVPLYI